MTLADVTLGTACSVDDQTDAVIPWEVTITNTTSGFSLSDASVQVELIRWNDPNLEYNLNLSYEYDAGGPQCSGENQASTEDGGPDVPAWGVTLAPHQSITLAAFAIVPGYYSPANPRGDSAELSGVELDVYGFGGSPESDATYTANSGTEILGDGDVGAPLP